MKYLKHSEIDFEKWDRTVVSCDLPLVFAESFYLNATCQDWDALVEGDYRSVMPLTKKRKLGIDYLAQPPFTPQLGVYGDHSKNIDSAFQEQLSSLFKFVDIEVNAHTDFPGRQKRTYVIMLGEKENRVDSNTKRNISKARKNGIDINSFTDHQPDLSKKYFHSFLSKSLKLSSSDIKIFDSLLESAASHNRLFTYTARRDSEIVAVAYFISNGKHAVYLKGINLDKNSGAMHLLMDEAIGFFRRNGNMIFDFGGGQNPTLSRFYNGFGAEELMYRSYKLNKLPFPLKLIKR